MHMRSNGLNASVAWWWQMLQQACCPSCIAEQQLHKYQQAHPQQQLLLAALCGTDAGMYGPPPSTAAGWSRGWICSPRHQQLERQQQLEAHFEQQLLLAAMCGSDAGMSCHPQPGNAAGWLAFALCSFLMPRERTWLSTYYNSYQLCRCACRTARTASW
jgi:hypothetical protein